MTRYVLMANDECGTPFNAGGCYFDYEVDAYNALPKAQERYPEARSFFIEPLFSDLAYEKYSNPDWENDYEDY